MFYYMADRALLAGYPWMLEQMESNFTEYGWYHLEFIYGIVKKKNTFLLISRSFKIMVDSQMPNPFPKSNTVIIQTARQGGQQPFRLWPNYDATQTQHVVPPTQCIYQVSNWYLKACWKKSWKRGRTDGRTDGRTLPRHDTSRFSNGRIESCSCDNKICIGQKIAHRLWVLTNITRPQCIIKLLHFRDPNVTQTLNNSWW